MSNMMTVFLGCLGFVPIALIGFNDYYWAGFTFQLIAGLFWAVLVPLKEE